MTILTDSVFLFGEVIFSNKIEMKDTKRELKITDDGSHTLYLPDFDEHYHSTFGAIQEATHIYIDAGLKKCTAENIAVLEVGFGTGLNCLLTAINTEKTIFYHGIELYPLSISQVKALNYPENIPNSQQLFQQLHQCDWNKSQAITPCFQLLKSEGDITTTPLSGNYDLVYFDAFAPDVQPELWRDEVFQKIYDHCNDNAILMTYCSKGIVKQALRAAGFTVKRLAGPPGKRHILQAIK